MPDFSQLLEKASTGKLRGKELPGPGPAWKLKRVDLPKSAPVSKAIYAEGPVRDWMAIYQCMHVAHLPVPELYAKDADKGCMLVEDLGDKRVIDLTPAQAQERWREAIELLVGMQSKIVPGRHTDLPPFSRLLDESVMIHQLDLFVDEALPKWFDISSKGTHLEPVRIEFARLARDLSALPRLFSHRAFAGRNLHLTPAKRMVITGFEGALMASPHYDLVSLVFDGFGHPPAELREELRLRHTEAGKDYLPAWDAETNRRAFDRVGLQFLMAEFGRIAEMHENAESLKREAQALDTLVRHTRELLHTSRDLDPLRRALTELVPDFRE